MLVFALAAVVALAAGDRVRESGIVSADLRLSAGRSKTLLNVSGLGRWTARCSAERRVSVEFIADHLLPTSDLVVARTGGPPLARRVAPGERVRPEPAANVLVQQWHVAPFAAAQVQVAVVTVSGRSLGPGDAYGCSASILVLTGPDQGATKTG